MSLYFVLLWPILENLWKSILLVFWEDWSQEELLQSFPTICGLDKRQRSFLDEKLKMPAIVNRRVWPRRWSIMTFLSCLNPRPKPNYSRGIVINNSMQFFFGLCVCGGGREGSWPRQTYESSRSSILTTQDGSYAALKVS